MRRRRARCCTPAHDAATQLANKERRQGGPVAPGCFSQALLRPDRPALAVLKVVTGWARCHDRLVSDAPGSGVAADPADTADRRGKSQSSPRGHGPSSLSDRCARLAHVHITLSESVATHGSSEDSARVVASRRGCSCHPVAVSVVCPACVIRSAVQTARDSSVAVHWGGAERSHAVQRCSLTPTCEPTPVIRDTLRTHWPGWSVPGQRACGFGSKSDPSGCNSRCVLT